MNVFEKFLQPIYSTNLFQSSIKGVLVAIFLFSCQKTVEPQKEPPKTVVVNQEMNLDPKLSAIGYGVNYNESLEKIDNRELDLTGTKWVRGFLEVFQLYDQRNALDQNERINKYLTLKDSGYNTWINLKFNFKTRPYPAAKSAEWNAYLDFVEVVLAKIMSKTDVLVVGNEPFIESENKDYDTSLLLFYQDVLERVNLYFSKNNIKKPIFLGATENIYTSNRQNNTAVNKFIDLAKQTPFVAGFDVHIHHTKLDEIDASLNYVSQRIRPEQKILISEFSLMKYWKEQLIKPISPAFILEANKSKTDKVESVPAEIKLNHEYINYALKNPRSAEEWSAYLQFSDWHELQKNYMCESFKRFKANPKFYLSAYAVRQSYPLDAEFNDTVDPWIMNSLIVARTVELKNGYGQPRYAFVEQFKKINQDGKSCD